MIRNFIPIILLALSMAFLPGRAMAVEPSEVYNLIFSDGDGYTTMIMRQIFGSLFGGVAGPSETPSIFQVFIGYFNVAAFLVVVILFFWSLSVGLIQSAHEGEVMGKRWSSVWVPLRLLFVVSLMIPLNSFGGYNGAQAFVAFIVNGGTAVATKVWSVGATQVITGVAPVSAPPSDVGVNVVRGIYEAEACAKSLNDQYAKVALATGTPPDRVIANERSLYDTDKGEDRMIITYDRISGTEGSYSVVQGSICGEITTPHIPEYISRRMNPSAEFESMSDVVDANQIRNIFSAMHIGVIQQLQMDLRSLVNRMDIRSEVTGNATDAGAAAGSTSTPPQPILDSSSGGIRYNLAKELARIIETANESLSVANANMLDVAVKTPNTNDVVRDMMVTKIVGTCSVTAITTGTVTPAKCYGEGWMGAGSWYMTIAHLNNEIYSLFSAKSVASSGYPYNHISMHTGGRDYPMREFGNLRSAQAIRADYDFNMAGYTRAFNDSLTGLTALGHNFTNGQLKEISLYTMSETDGTFGFGKLGEPGVIDRVFSDIKESLVGAAQTLHDFSFDEDPIISIWKIGNVFIEISGMLAVGDIAIPGSILGTIAAVLFTAGSAMAFVLPMMPFMFWILAVSGYLLLVVEAVVSVNLWAVSMMRMDGEGISGEAGRKGWMVLLALAMTPLLMIGGFIVGMIIFRVTTALIGGGMALALNGILGLALIPMISGLFVLGIMVVAFYMFIIERSFSLVATFPSRVLSMVGEQVDVDAGGIGAARGAAAGAVGGAGAASSKAFRSMNEKFGPMYAKAKNTPAGSITGPSGKSGRRAPSSST